MKIFMDFNDLMTRPTSGCFRNFCFWLATPNSHAKTLPRCSEFCACPSSGIPQPFHTHVKQLCPILVYSRMHWNILEYPILAYSRILEEASLQSGSLSEFCRVHVKSNATRKAMRSHHSLTCLLDVFCHLGLV